MLPSKSSAPREANSGSLLSHVYPTRKSAIVWRKRRVWDGVWRRGASGSGRGWSCAAEHRGSSRAAFVLLVLAHAKARPAQRELACGPVEGHALGGVEEHQLTPLVPVPADGLVLGLGRIAPARIVPRHLVAVEVVDALHVLWQRGAVRTLEAPLLDVVYRHDRRRVEGKRRKEERGQ